MGLIPYKMSSSDSEDESYVNSSDFSDIREEHLFDIEGLLCKSVDEIRKVIEGKNYNYIHTILNYSIERSYSKIYNVLFAIEMLRNDELSNKVDKWLMNNMNYDIDLRFYQYLKGKIDLSWENIFYRYKNIDPYIIDKLMSDKWFSEEDAKKLKDRNLLVDKEDLINFIDIRYGVNVIFTESTTSIGSSKESSSSDRSL